jgi:hypothetical protein
MNTLNSSAEREVVQYYNTAAPPTSKPSKSNLSLEHKDPLDLATRPPRP